MPAPAVTLHTTVTKDEARALTQRIRDAVDNLWALVTEAHETGAWKALGYGSWGEYVEAELSFTPRRSYQLLDQALFIRALAESASVSAESVCTMVHTSERAARELAPRIPEVTAAIRERVESGEPPEYVVPDVVQQHREQAAQDRKAAKSTPPPPESEDDEHAPDLVAELEAADVEIRRLQALVESLQADDLSREVVSWSAKYAQLNGRLQQAITTGNEAARQAQAQAKLLAKIRKTLGVDTNAEIFEALEFVAGGAAS